MQNIEKLIQNGPFSLKKDEKKVLYKNVLNKLINHHYKNCREYKKILDALKFSKERDIELEQLPFIPVRLFKDYHLKSVVDNEVFKTMTSSGTSGQNVSKIYLDKNTASFQTKVLGKILSDYIGKKRLPMLIIDTKNILKDRNSFSARGAGILGFTMFGFDITYALDENMEIDINTIEIFLEKHKNEKILLFGFTSIIWEYLYKRLKNEKKQLKVNNGILIHGGGWKKLLNEAVDNDTFKKEIYQTTSIKQVYNYYGMIEQTGSIFMECEKGYLHCSDYSDIEIIDENFKKCDFNKEGIVKLYSLLPYSYPGHILLTEDSGEIIGEDTCSCGRKGKYFKIHGRIKNADIRGCSDTYEFKK